MGLLHAFELRQILILHVAACFKCGLRLSGGTSDVHVALFQLHGNCMLLLMTVFAKVKACHPSEGQLLST